MTAESFLPHLTNKNIAKLNPAAAPDSGSKLSLESIRTQDSSRRVAAARTARSVLVLPEEGDPQSSDKQPRGKPPASASIWAMPDEAISGFGRTSSREAGRTSTKRADVAR